MTQPTTTRRDLLRLGTSAAAYAAGAAIVTGVVTLSAAPAAVDSRFEALRREYIAIHRGFALALGDETDPRYLSAWRRQTDIEEDFIASPSRSAADAQAKLRFIIDQSEFGMELDGDQATMIVRDAARYLVDGEA